MHLIPRSALLLLFPLVGGCIAVLPIAEFIPSTPAGTIHTSNCVGAKSVRYDLDGVPAWVELRSSGMEGKEPRLFMGMILSEGRVARIPLPEVRIKPLDERPEEIHPMPAWGRYVFRKKTRRTLERVAAETAPATGPLVGGKPVDGDGALNLTKAKAFTIEVSLKGLPARGYRIQLPPVEIDGKAHSFAPIEYRLEYRVEFMAPLNC